MCAEKLIKSTFKVDKSISTLPAAWAASTWKKIFLARVISPIAATSVIVPISLFTIINDTKMVSGRIAASTISGVIKPVCGCGSK